MAQLDSRALSGATDRSVASALALSSERFSQHGKILPTVSGTMDNSCIRLESIISPRSAVAVSLYCPMIETVTVLLTLPTGKMKSVLAVLSMSRVRSVSLNVLKPLLCAVPDHTWASDPGSYSRPRE
jgi:hypothetical protein